jgi:acyl-CoA reductase-like NAD-dependent aldehyde dehydrogenase
VDTQTVDQLRSTDPATGELVATLPVHDAVDVRAVVDDARAAQEWWGALSHAGRRAHLRRWAAHLARHADELCALIRTENGKPLDDAFLELTLALEHIRWAADHAATVLAPRHVFPGLLMINHAAVIERRPLGVIGVIGPWNYPIYTPAGSIAHALAAGNTVVFKPSEYTSAIGRSFVDAFALANPDAPAGVLAAVTGFGETGAALIGAGVDKVAFTGSTATGRKVLAAAAATMTPVVLECGGKDALIVAEDADLRAAADAAAFGAMGNAGQTCVGVERIYVVEAVRERFLAELSAALQRIRPGADDAASYGPMTMPAQIDVVRRHIDAALASGATAVIGGPESVRPPFVDPVVLLDADEGCAAVREETFGPVVTVRTVADVDEAVELTNASEYGLASTVFSRRHGMEIARRLRVGATSVNALFGFAGVPALPFGGVGPSGFGRVHGADGMLEYTRTHSITRQRFAVPGVALVSFRRTAAVMSLVRGLVRLRHG